MIFHSPYDSLDLVQDSRALLGSDMVRAMPTAGKQKFQINATCLSNRWRLTISSQRHLFVFRRAKSSRALLGRDGAGDADGR